MLASAGILIKFGTIASFIFLSIFCENGLSYKIGVFKWKKQKTKNKKKNKKNKQTKTTATTRQKQKINQRNLKRLSERSQGIVK